MTKIIAFVEDEFEVKTILKKNILPDIWIALEPFCINKLEAHKFNYSINENIIDKNAFLNDVGLQSQKIKNELIELVDIWVKNNYESMRSSGLSILIPSTFRLDLQQ
ncbi:MAG: hypothetical protein RDU14_06960 [Melioribacteraceae bacterium]|nr:hypothetical protein [Melioribacteraceae bacterium]